MAYKETTLMKFAKQSKISKLIVLYAADPHNPILNFIVGYAYDNIGQTASAVSFYLRAAEKSEDSILKYESLLRASACFDSQGSRTSTTRGLLQHAISIRPSRPEAYYFLSRTHERCQEWQEAYMLAAIGLNVCETVRTPLRTDIGYPGKYVLLFQLAVPAWWCGLCEQSREILTDLRDNYEMDTIHVNAVAYNLKNIGQPLEISKYDNGMVDDLRYKFNGCEDIDVNYSQTYQDLFVLSMLDGKREGTYLELGSADPFYNNNTALLETKFDWKGVSIDYNRDETNKFFKERRNTVLCLDALQTDFNVLLSMSSLSSDIDYLQLDCDPATATLEILKKIPFDLYRFATITFEHDAYRVDGVREESRAFLTEKGYKLVASDIAVNEVDSYEDWWVHPELVDPKIVEKMTDVSEGAKFCKDYMFKSEE